MENKQKSGKKEPFYQVVKKHDFHLLELFILMLISFYLMILFLQSIQKLLKKFMKIYLN